MEDMMSRRLLAVVAALGVAGATLVTAPAAIANGVPAAPTITATTVLPQAAGTPATGGKVTVDWTPAAPLNADDTWVVTSSPGGITATVAGNVNTAEVGGLTLGTAYTFTVTGEDSNGVGEPSAASSPAVIPYATPTAPLNVSVVAGNEQAAVTWSAPANTGGVPIISYTATAALVSDPDTTKTCTPAPATATSCVITGLTNSSQYSVTVTATNQGTAGLETSAASSPGVLVTPTATSGLPSVPSGAVVANQVTGKTIEVSFGANSTGPTGFPVTGYVATCTSTTPSAATPVTGTNAASPILITSDSPTAGATYTCRVQARNANGDSGFSAVSNAVVMNTTEVLGAPTIGTPTGGAGEATVRWTAPSPSVGLTGYQVAYLTGGVWSLPLTLTSTTTTTVLSLPAGSYQFRVRALNTGGASAWSNASNPAVTVTEGTLPAPTGVVGTPGLAQVGLTWNAPTGGTLTPTSYQVRYSSNAGATWTELAATGTTTTSATVTGLTNGTAYVFAVRAISDATTSDWSATSATVTPGTPGVPTNVIGTPGDGRVTLTWTAPTGTPAASGYQVQFAISGTTTWLPETPLAATSASLTVTGLTNGTAYVFRVRALNGPVPGDYSTISAAVTPEATAAILISGTRGKGNESRRIFVVGNSTGLPTGTVLAPFIRFPGEIGMTIGDARRQVNAQGEFEWTRLTGKRIAIRFARPDDTLRSNRIIIEAR